jgi:hypothetical protein
MIYRQLSTTIAAAFLLGGLTVAVAGSGKFSEMSFGPTDVGSIVIFKTNRFTQDATVHFREIDLNTLEFTKRNFEIQTNPYINRLKTSDKELQRLVGDSLGSRTIFAPKKAPTGDFVLSAFSIQGVRAGSACFEIGMPVYRFEPGKIHLITDDMEFRSYGLLSMLFQSMGFNAKGSKPSIGELNSVERDHLIVTRVLSEYENIKGFASIAKVVAIVSYQQKDGSASGCYKSKKIIRLDKDEI